MTWPEKEFLPRSSSIESDAGPTDSQPAEHTALACIKEAILDPLPNDLTRMIYLASLRDCNSGRYLHPDLSPGLGVEEADRVLRACHEEIFQRLLVARFSEYVLQLEEYIQYTRTEQTTVLQTWESLQAYRATIPVHARPISAELFSLNIDVALVILGERNVPVG